MTDNIKFKKYHDNYMCKDWFYSIKYEDESFNRIQMDDYECRKLFKEMAKELGYQVIKKE